MGFNSSFTGRDQNLERETLDYLQTRPELSYAMTSLMVELKRLGKIKKSCEEEKSGIKVRVRNQLGQEVVMTIVGVNSTSLISSEMEGHLAFTFIKSVSSLEVIREKMEETEIKERRFTLVKG